MLRPSAITFMILVVLMTGCQTTTKTLPKCNGYEKRPLNPSMWGSQPPQDHSGLSGSPTSADPLAFAPASLRAFPQTVRKNTPSNDACQ